MHYTKGMKLLLIEDEPQLLDAYKKGLSQEGYGIDTARTIKEAQDYLSYNDYDLVLLDLNLPDGNGLDLLHELRMNNTQVKIIIVSALNQTQIRIQGLDEGANDYLTKPFDFEELKARIRALLRRDFSLKPNRLILNDFSLDLSLHQIFYQDKVVALTVKEYAIFSYLMQNVDRVISAEELLEKCWNDELDPFSDVMRVHIYALRKKIHALTQRDDVIVTLKGVGYTLNL